MSAQMGGLTPKVNRDLNLLAPKFKAAVELAITECNQQGMEAMVYEGFRSQELQAIYYARGRTVIPPTHTVTNAPTNLYSWHGYGLAVDIVHQRFFWEPPTGEAWFKEMAKVFKRHDCSWGGDWNHPDTPHIQWGKCKPSPSDRARQLLAQGGVRAVWAAVDAV